MGPAVNKLLSFRINLDTLFILSRCGCLCLVFNPDSSAELQTGFKLNLKLQKKIQYTLWLAVFHTEGFFLLSSKTICEEKVRHEAVPGPSCHPTEHLITQNRA